MPDQEARDRRAAKKAQTRVTVLRAAQRLFTERSFGEVTVADVAAAADVAVQTVFNHFPTKEDLFFADRTPWVTGPATAVLSRRPGTGAVATVHAWLVDQVATVPAQFTQASARQYMQTILGSPSLLRHHRELFREAEDRLADALRATWAAELGDLPGLRFAAAMTSGMQLTGARVVLHDQWVELYPVPVDAPGLPDLVAAVRRTSRQAMDAVVGGFPELATREDAPAVLRAVARLETGRRGDDRVVRSIQPPLPQESATTGSSTVSTRSVTSAEVIGTANAV